MIAHGIILLRIYRNNEVFVVMGGFSPLAYKISASLHFFKAPKAGGGSGAHALQAAPENPQTSYKSWWA